MKKSGFYHKTFKHKVEKQELHGAVTILGEIVILECCDFEHADVFLPTGLGSAMVYKAVAGNLPNVRFVEHDLPVQKWAIGLSDNIAKKVIPILKAHYVLWE